MKRVSLICLLIVLCGLPAYSQFWINFGWNEPHCQSCLWMEKAMRLPNRKAAEYHKIIHKYGQRIEKETRRDYRSWNKVARKIFDLRMERDRKIRNLLTPAQFNLYVRYVRERPQRIHDYRGWYSNPRYPDRRPTSDCRHYEDRYWDYRWDHRDRDDRHDRDDRYNRDDRHDRDDRDDRGNGRGHGKNKKYYRNGRSS